MANIVQDKNNIIWVSELNGLNKLDGLHIKKILPNRNDSTTIPNQPITNLKVDNNNNIWLCSNGYSVSKIDTKTEKVSYLKQNLDFAHFNQFGEKNILIDRKNIYNASNEKLIPYTNTFTPFIHFGDTMKSYVSTAVDKYGEEWACVRDRIFKINKTTKKAEETYVFPELAFINYLFFDSHNRCWVSSPSVGGLVLFDTKNKKIKRLDYPDINYPGDYVEWTFNNKKYIVLAVAARNYIPLIDEETLELIKYDINDIIASDYKLIDTRSVFVDNKNNLWLVTNNGLFIINGSPTAFTVNDVPNINAKNVLKGQYDGIFSIKLINNTYWLSKANGWGIYNYTKNWDLIKHYDKLVQDDKNNFLKIGGTTNEAFDFIAHKNKIYITTNAGLVLLDTATKTTKIIHTANQNEISYLRTIVPINENIWYIRSANMGVEVFDVNLNKFIKNYPMLDNGNKILTTNYLLKLRNAEIVATTNDGLYCLNTSTDKFKKIDIPNLLFKGQSGMAEDKNGIIWITNDANIFAYDFNKKKIVKDFKKFNDPGGEFRVTVDKNNNVWFNSYAGYWCYKQATDEMIKFTYSMGLPLNRLNCTIESLSDSFVYAGGYSSVVKFDPDFFYKNAVSLMPIISDIYANEKKIITKYKNDSIENVTIQRNENNISISIGLNDFSLPNNYEIFYKIKFENDSWIKTNDANINFNNLPHGEYNIEIIAKNKLTEKYGKIKLLQLIVLPYWYETNLAKILFALILASVIYYFVKLRIKNIRTQASLKQKITETEIAALKAQMNPHFIFNCINSIDGLIQTNDKYNATNYLNKFAKLIRNVLESSKENTVMLSKDIETLKLYIALEKLRSNYEFELELNIGKELLENDYMVPPLIIQPFVENAIQHGIRNKITNDGVLQINIERIEDKIVYTIIDNGVGRKLAKELKTHENESYGMQISEDRIKLFNNEEKASIKIEDLFANNVPAGTKVTVQLKIK